MVKEYCVIKYGQRRMAVKVICQYCKKEFLAVVSQSHGKYCSLVCTGLASKGKHHKRKVVIPGQYDKALRKFAAQVINNLILCRRIKRPTICPACNKKDFIEAHHIDYYKPYIVQWMCRVCHIKIHKGENIDSEILTFIPISEE